MIADEEVGDLSPKGFPFGRLMGGFLFFVVLTCPATARDPLSISDRYFITNTFSQVSLVPFTTQTLALSHRANLDVFDFLNFSRTIKSETRSRAGVWRPIKTFCNNSRGLVGRCRGNDLRLSISNSYGTLLKELQKLLNTVKVVRI